MTKRILTAIQPTNNLTLGNYLGAIKNFASYQNEYECFAFVADLHAMTTKYDAKSLKAQTLKTLATYIAAGINPKVTNLFIQSHIKEHLELEWILNCHSYMGELGRMHQFKEKSAKQEQNISVGLFTYPVLMAADILLYDTHYVPVGEDQKQHIELVRDLSKRMNGMYGENTFTTPEVINPKFGSKIMSLQNPLVKMSKSDANPNSTIFLTDSNDSIMKKFKKAVTDSGTNIEYSDEKPGIKNLIQIQCSIMNKTPEEIVSLYSGKGYGDFKKETADLVVSVVEPIREETNKILENDLGYMIKLIRLSTQKASQLAKETMKRVRERVGLVERMSLL